MIITSICKWNNPGRRGILIHPNLLALGLHRVWSPIRHQERLLSLPLLAARCPQLSWSNCGLTLSIYLIAWIQARQADIYEKHLLRKLSETVGDKHREQRSFWGRRFYCTSLPLCWGPGCHELPCPWVELLLAGLGYSCSCSQGVRSGDPVHTVNG